MPFPCHAVPLKADSHTTCRAHAVSLPCRAAKGLEYVFPIWFTQCGRVWFTLAMPCPCYAPTMPFFSRPRHSTSVERRPVGYLTASVSSGYHAEFHDGRYQTYISLRSRWPVWNQTPFVMDDEKIGSSRLQKDDLLHCWTSSSDISGYHADFHEGHGAIGAGQGKGMGTACYVWIGLNSHMPCRAPAMLWQCRVLREI